MSAFKEYRGRYSWCCLDCQATLNKINAPKINAQHNDRLHRLGRCQPMAANKRCALYLGVVVAERVLSKFFDHIERMPTGNPGYDFICGKGFKIDAKSACLIKKATGLHVWHFNVRRNMSADYFLFLAFDDRENLTPLHVWLIPGDVINNVSGIEIHNNPIGMSKWARYERPIDNVVACCEKMKL